MKTTLAATAILLLGGMPAHAHRLDEYLQGALLTIEKSRLAAQITLTPGIAVLPAVLASIDTDGDGLLSEAERRAYAGHVLRDLSLTIDDHPLTPQLLSMRYPTIEEMRDGGGQIEIEFSAQLPRGGPNRRLVLKNDHQSRIAAYQVNCLVPSDPGIRIVAQNRNYSQSFYQVEYVQAGVPSDWLSSAWWSGDREWLGAVALLLLARFAWLWLRRSTAAAVAHAEACAPTMQAEACVTGRRRPS
jgi:hypothetical protein